VAQGACDEVIHSKISMMFGSKQIPVVRSFLKT